MSFPNERLQKSFERLRPHGTRARYQQGCKCFQCRLACTRYAAELKRRKQKGDLPNPIISARRTRRHLRLLRKHGVGLSVVSAVTGIARRTISDIRSGKAKNIRAEKERLIFQVTVTAKVDGSLVPANRTRQLVLELQGEGFTQEQIAVKARVSKGSFTPRKRNVFARTEMRVEKFYNAVMAEAA